MNYIKTKLATIVGPSKRTGYCYSEQIMEGVLENIEKLYSKEEIRNGIKVYVSADYLYFLITSEGNTLFRERMNDPEDAIAEFKAMKNYLREEGYEPIEKSSDCFMAILKP